MTKTQKIIKYFAISLAILLIVSIFSTIISIISSIFNFRISSDNLDNNIVEINNKIDILDIDLKNSKLSIKYNSVFKVESNENISIKERNNKLIIRYNNGTIRRITKKLKYLKKNDVDQYNRSFGSYQGYLCKSNTKFNDNYKY